MVDTGPLYSLRDADDRYHVQCADFARNCVGELVVPCTVLSEVSFLIEKNLRDEEMNPLLDDLESGALSLENVTVSDYSRIRELVTQYADLRLGFVDASIVALAERLDIRTVFTLDRRHFSTLRPRHVDAFALVPEHVGG